MDDSELTSPDRVRTAMAAISRSDFLPPELQDRAGEDRALPIGYDSTNSQPSTVRLMLQQLAVRPGHRVLDVGSGSGWTTALLGTLAGPNGHVVGVEIVPELITRARAALGRYDLPGVRIAEAVPSRLGAPDDGPWDRILVSADAGEVPAELVDQLADGGRMVLPVDGAMTVVVRTGNSVRTTRVPGRWMFVPLQQ
ncbi:protein-L-isoaspartate O-methyltransferase family protein [Propionibacteriaceae bacterium Y2011]